MISTTTIKNAALSIEHDLFTDPDGSHYLVKDGAILRRWEPLEDDGDAFRLALKLQIKIEYEPEMDSLMCSLPGSQGATTVAAIGDIELRYAIVRCASIYGESLKCQS
jgi:hypothetical protein